MADFEAAVKAVKRKQKPSLNIERGSAKSLSPDKKNPNKSNERGAEMIGQSLERLKAGRSLVVDRKNRVISGNQTLKAYRKLGKDDPAVMAELTKNEDLDLSWMYSDSEIDEIIAQNCPVELLTDEDDVPEPPKVPKSKSGDIYLLGNHKVMCGDSTSSEDVAKLMDGAKADMVFTDPPYGINYEGLRKRHAKIANDGNLEGIESLIAQVLANDCPMFICCNWQCFSTFERAMFAAKRIPKACIVWDKKVRIQNLDRFFKQHEFIMYSGPFGGKKTVDGDVWECSRETREDHPTAKPVELIRRAIEHVSVPGDSVQDLFGGSGSTLIACETTGRKAYLMELDESYVDVIITRYEQSTGKKAVLYGNKEGRAGISGKTAKAADQSKTGRNAKAKRLPTRR